MSRKVADLQEFWRGQKRIILLDQNLLACSEKMELLEQLVDSHAQVEFNGGMDVRLLDEEILSALEKIKVKDYHFAWDDPRENLEEQFRLFRDAPFVKVDNLDYPEVKKCIESFVYGVNTPSRWGTQAPFSNITLDWTVPADLAELPAIVGGKPQDFCYKDCKKEMDMINRAFIETMIEGDANGRGFQLHISVHYKKLRFLS